MQYSNYDMKNNVHATLSTAVSSVATTIQLTSGQGSRFGTTFPQIATLESFDENGKVIKREIVKITGRSGDNLTVVRAFAPCPANDDANSQSQSSVSFNSDDTISLYIPKEIFDKISDSLNDIYDNGTNKLRTEVVSGLELQVNAGPVLVGSGYYDFAGDTITLTDNATNYIEIDEDGLLVANTISWNDRNTKIAIVTTASGSVTAIADRRLGTIGGKIGGVNIHDLTQKITPNGEDEMIISDSENIWNNKKLKLKALFGNNMGEPTDFSLDIIDSATLGIKYTDPTVSQPSIKTIPSFANDRSKSYIIKKEGSDQTSPEDGTIINTSTTKDEYKTVGFEDTIDSGKDYYYRIVSEADNGIKTYCDNIKVSTKVFLDFLLIGGGAGGGSGTGSGQRSGGGGGAGGVILKQGVPIISSGNGFDVVIGSGGASNTNGGNSSFMGFVAYGGGTSLQDGGSGGGGKYGEGIGHGTPGQGNDGGIGTRRSDDYRSAGGGGGAGGVGGDADSNNIGRGGTGGIGITSDISGTSTQYAGGGGGGGRSEKGLGSYGGGNGGEYNGSGTNAPGNATTYGSGGGGGTNGNGGTGMQGILIIRYLTASGLNATGGTITTSGDYTIHTFTSDGTFTINE